MNLLITGATGHSAQYFLEHLNNNPIFDEVICIIRNDQKKHMFKRFNKINFKYIISDLDQLETITNEIGNVDVILNIANISFSLDILEHRENLEIDWFIGIHTTGKYSKYKSASAEYIKIEEKIKKIDDVDITLLRPTMIYGSLRDRNMSKLIKFIDKFPVFPVFGKGKNLMQPVSAQDLGRAYYDVIINSDTTRNNNYNLSGKDEVEYKYIIETIAGLLNKKIRLIHVPIKLSTSLVKIGNIITSKFPVTEEQVLRMQEDKIFSHEKAAKDFGFNPLNFYDGISFEVQEYLDKKGVQ